ncbi:uncharacterized protein LOC134222599 [Armigeres subalbatus]|uniref:uncharacterized protein LOC134222599 n=1 Tax=Armigeres subalbatus TaxID=124917 RepID=UPI002ED3F448
MPSNLLNASKRPRYNGIDRLTNKVPSLYQQSIKILFKHVICVGQRNKRISKLQNLPVTVLIMVLEEMSSYPSLRRSLHRELSDPKLFMRVFMHLGADRSVLEKCLRKASFLGKPVLPDMANSWCKMMNADKTAKNSSQLMNNISAATKLGTYLQEVGWWNHSKKVLDIALLLISQVTETQLYSSLNIECMCKLLRAEGILRVTENADETCDALLKLAECIEDDGVLAQIFLEVASYHEKAERLTESQTWTTKALELLVETSSIETVVEILLLKGRILYRNRRYEDGNLVIGQAIHRARSTFGFHDRRYANALFTYGACLMMTASNYSTAISVLLEPLDIFSKLYGNVTPQVAVIHFYLAYGLYYRDIGLFDVASAYDSIQRAILLAEQIMPERRQFIDLCGEVRAAILTELNECLGEESGNRAGLEDFQILTVAEIKQKCTRRCLE